jgi:hypothetical protein
MLIDQLPCGHALLQHCLRSTHSSSSLLQVVLNLRKPVHILHVGYEVGADLLQQQQQCSNWQVRGLDELDACHRTSSSCRTKHDAHAMNNPAEYATVVRITADA